MSRDTDTESRLAFLDFHQVDRDLLSALGPALERHADSIVASFYRHLLSFEATRELLKDPVVKERLLLAQHRYLLSLADPRCDEEYVAERRRIGQAHERAGLAPRWYLGAYAHYFALLAPIVVETCGNDPLSSERTLTALYKLLMFDAQLAMEAYIEHHAYELEYLNSELAEVGRRLGRDYTNQRVELEETRQRAQAAEELASIATLVAGLAHEIGTPMGVIQGHAKLLESAVSGEDARWRLQTIQAQIGRISKIIQTLLNMARPGKSRRQPVALGPLIESTLSFVSEKLRRRSIEVDSRLATSPSVMGDPERLQQLLLNLLLNAADAMPSGGKLRVSVAPDGDDAVEVRVADTGAGITPDDLDRIFEPFFTTKAAGEGNGLGLMVAKGIVSDHGGSIEVTSEEGKGTAFCILFPVDVGKGASPERASA